MSLDKNDPHYQYKRIAAAEELVNSNALLDLYSRLYKKKYRGEPIFPVSNAHLTQIKDFSRAVGDKAHGIMQHYFEMKDDWFIKQAYSLDCLIKNIHKVSASYSQRTNREHLHAGKRENQVYCDACWEEFTLLCDMNHDWDRPIICDTCKQTGKKPKRLTKEERHRTILKLGNAFPEMPSAITEQEKENKVRSAYELAREEKSKI